MSKLLERIRDKTTPGNLHMHRFIDLLIELHKKEDSEGVRKLYGEYLDSLKRYEPKLSKRQHLDIVRCNLDSTARAADLYPTYGDYNFAMEHAALSPDKTGDEITRFVRDAIGYHPKKLIKKTGYRVVTTAELTKEDLQRTYTNPLETFRQMTGR